MSKRFRNIIVLTVVLLLLIGVNLIVYITDDKTDKNAEVDEIIYISNYSVDSVTKIEIDNKHGSLVLVAENGLWYIEDDRDAVLDLGVVAEVAYMLTHIAGQRNVNDGEDTTNIYGMLTPAATITTHHDGMLEQSFVIGDKAPIENEYYMQSSVLKKVYTVDSSYYTYADITAEDLMVLNGINIEHGDMKKIEIINTLGQQYTIQRTADDNNISLCYWEFAEPFDHDADTAVLYGSDTYDGMITYITQLAGEGILGYLDTDSVEYGQDNPIFTAVIYGADNQHQSFAVGDYSDENNYSITFSDDNIIYKVAKDRVPFISYSAFYTADSNLGLINIDSVENISIDLPNVKTLIDIEHYVVKTAEGSDYIDTNGNLVYKAEISIEGLDESNISAANIYEQKIMFYQYLTTIKIDNLVIEGLHEGKYIGNIVYGIQSAYKDTYKIELYEYSKSHYMAKKNDEDTAYLVNVKSIEELAQKFELLKAGNLE